MSVAHTDLVAGPRGSGYAPVNGVRMYYELHGDGRPLVLLHGGLHTFELSFAAVLPALATGRMAIGVDLQGHGRTRDIDRAPSIADLAADVVGLLDHLELDRADVFGFSLGGLVGLDCAIRYPTRVGRLVAASVHYRADGYYPEIRDPARSAGSTRLPTWRDFDEMRRAYERVAPDPARFDVLAAKIGETVGAVRWTEDELRSISAPTLLIIGDHDFVRPEHALAMRGFIPDVRLAVLPDTTHMDVMCRSELIEPMVRTFLADTSACDERRRGDDDV